MKEIRRKEMKRTRSISDQQICHLSDEEKYFALIERRYQEQGYELLETCCPNQRINTHELSRNNVLWNKDSGVQSDGLIGLEAI